MTIPALRVRLFGVPVEIRASFAVLIVLIGLPMHLSPELMLAWVVIATLAVFVHEAGHAVAFIAFGDRPQITLHGNGGHTLGSHQGVTPMILVSSAGPFAGLVLGLIVLLAMPYVPENPFTSRLLDDALFATIGLSLINLVPLGSLDGNAILNGLVAATTGRPPGWVGVLLAGAIVAILAVAAVWLGRPEAAILLGLLVGLQWRGGDGLFGWTTGRCSAAEHLRLGRAADALVRAESELDRNPTDLDAIVVRAAALTSMTRYDEAEVEYTTVLSQAPTNPHALAGRFVVLRALGRTEQASFDLDALLAPGATDHTLVVSQFYALYHDHQYARALDLVRYALAHGDERGPVADQLYGLEAAVDIALGRPEIALRQALRLVAKRPDDHTLHELCALALIQLGELDQARSRTSRALAGAPRHPELLETLGIVERLSGRPDVAVDRLLESAVARPDLPRARAELSACFTQLGRHVEATAALDTLPPWAGDDPNVLYARGSILVAAGGGEDALRLITRAAAIRPSLARIARLDPVVAPLFAEGADATGAALDRLLPA